MLLLSVSPISIIAVVQLTALEGEEGDMHIPRLVKRR